MKKQTNKNEDLSLIIHGDPTKDFFISMLIKDITLRDAIGDLIDNSVDGAKRNASDPKDLSKFWIKITTDNSKFEIIDNCGGIESKIAREYAFRFGRPSEYKLDPNSISQFGIGMKRAFFKIGEKIEITSVAKNSKFKMKIDVPTWKDDLKAWDFKFKAFSESISNSIDKTQTAITVKAFSEDSKKSFDDKIFFNLLKIEISREHLFALIKGLSISINGIKLKPTILTLINNDDFKPAYWHHKFESGLNVDVYAGISSDNGEEGGWYIFCNERLVTGPDTSTDTGWTGRKKDSDGVAEYHDQFHRFRGYVFFESKDAAKLPWMTTKTRMDLDSAEYQSVRSKMINMMKPVMSLMNKLKKEKEKNTPKPSRILNNKLENIVPLSIINVVKDKKKLKEIFFYPDSTQKRLPRGEGIIKYSRPYAEIDKVRLKLRVTRLEEVGEKTFNYYYKNEIGE